MRKRLGSALAAAAVVALPASAATAPSHQYLVEAFRLDGRPAVVEILGPDGRPRRVVSRPVRWLPGRASWAPDGSLVAWDSRAGIWVQRASGGSARLLVRAQTGCRRECRPLTFAWSPDARQLLVGGAGALTNRLLLVDVASGAARDAVAPQQWVEYAVSGWSPDGRSFAVVRASGDVTTSCCTLELVVANADGSGARTIFRSAEPIHDFPQATWSPDSRSLAITTDGRDPRDPRLGVVDVQTGALRVLKGVNPYSQSVSWSPDSQRLAVANVDRPVVTLSAAGGDVRSLGVRGHAASWEPSGDVLVLRGARQVLQSRDGREAPRLLFRLPKALSLYSLDAH